MQGGHPQQDSSHHVFEQSHPIVSFLKKIKNQPTDDGSNQKERKQADYEFPVGMPPVNQGCRYVGGDQDRQKQPNGKRHAYRPQCVLQNKGVNGHRQVSGSRQPTFAHSHDERPKGQKGPMQRRQRFHLESVNGLRTCTRKEMTELGPIEKLAFRKGA